MKNDMNNDIFKGKCIAAIMAIVVIGALLFFSNKAEASPDYVAIDTGLNKYDIIKQIPFGYVTYSVDTSKGTKLVGTTVIFHGKQMTMEQYSEKLHKEEAMVIQQVREHKQVLEMMGICK